MSNELKSKSELLDALKDCKIVMLLPNFGQTERYLKISKSSARELISRIRDDDTPQSFGMYGELFGEVTNGILYLG